jgi:hypothetical protein
MEVEPRQAPPQSWLSALGALGALAAGSSASLSVRVMIGTRLAAIVLAVTNDGMLADFAFAVLTGTGVICHEFDSIFVVVKSQLSSRTLNSDCPFPVLVPGLVQHMDSKPPKVNDRGQLFP